MAEIKAFAEMANNAETVSIQLFWGSFVLVFAVVLLPFLLFFVDGHIMFIYGQ